MKEYLKITLLPKDTNMHGTIFGGVIMSHIDLAGAICARDGFDNVFVTVFINEIRFLHPVFVGDLLTFWGEMVEHSTSSVTVDIKVEAERLTTREVCKVTEARLVFVAVDGKQHKTALVPRASG